MLLDVSVLKEYFSRVRVMVVNATFNNISVIFGNQFLLVEETRVPGKNQRPAIFFLYKDTTNI